MSRQKHLNIAVEDLQFRALATNASRLGMYLNDFAVLMITRGLDEYAKQLDNVADPDIRLWRHAYNMKRLRDARGQLVGSAIQLMQIPDEDSYDELVSLCEAFGFSINEITDIAKEKTDRTDEVHYRGTKVDQASGWLINFLSDKPDSSDAMRSIVTEGVKIGFSESTIKAAKKQLKMETNFKNGKWIWTLPDEGENNVA
jgi:hypothetical protein